MHWYVMTSDRGSNEVVARRIVFAEAATSPHVIVLSSDCYEHAGHLCTLGGLKAIDAALVCKRDWKYYSSVAIMSNCMRELAKPVFKEWERQHGARSAMECVFI